MSMQHDSVRVDWGMMGHEIFQGRYSRKKPDGARETFPEAIDRVVEGNCAFVDPKHIEPTEKQELRDLLLDMKLLPGGRHLFATGVKGRQYVSNCWSGVWDPASFSRHFEFAFARLMEGGGVGSDYSDRWFQPYPRLTHHKGFYMVCSPDHPDYDEFKEILNPEYSHTWHGCRTVSDSKDGWVEALHWLLESYFHPEEEPLVLDLSQVRAKGKPLRTFGGTASGPGPLAKALDNIHNMMDGYVGEYPDWLLAMRIDNEIASCVVAGNVRRSARISTKHWADPAVKEFIELKLDSVQQHNTTNLSVSVDDDFWAEARLPGSTANRVLDCMVRCAYVNGEPGMINASLHQATEPGEFFCTNPCFTGDTPVGVADGRGAVPFRQLAEEGVDVPVYTRDENDRLVVRWMRNPRKTGEMQPVYRVRFDDGMELCTTGNHRWELTSGETKTTLDLVRGDAVPAMTRLDLKTKATGQKYTFVTKKDQRSLEHVLMSEFYLGRKLGVDEVVHHRDRDGLNNDWSNLEVLRKEAHDDLHSANMLGDKNPMRRWFPRATKKERQRYRKRMSMATSGSSNGNAKAVASQEIFNAAVRLAASMGRGFSVREWQRYARRNGYPVQFTAWRQSTLGSICAMSERAAAQAGVAPLPKDAAAARCVVINWNRYQKAVHGDYLSVHHNGDWNPIVTRACEGCGVLMELPWVRREICLCRECSKNHAIEARKASLRELGKKQSASTSEGQTRVFNDLKVELGREPLKWEWEARCRTEDVPTRLHPNAIPTYSALKDEAALVNHRVVSVEFSGYEDVYNGTVDEFHRFYVGHHETTTRSGHQAFRYVETRNCGEVSLEQAEPCNLGHVNLAKFNVSTHAGMCEMIKAFRLMARFLLRATFSDIIDEQSREIVSRNRRVGVGITGFHDWLLKHGCKYTDFPRSLLTEVLHKAHKAVRAEVRSYAYQLRIPEPVKCTTVAPTGTTSILAGVSNGMHPILYRYFKRRVEFSITDEDSRKRLENMKAQGYEYEKSLYKPDTEVVIYYCKHPTVGHVREDLVEESGEISIAQFMEVQAALQEVFADNSISATINFDPDDVGERHIFEALLKYGPRLKGVTIMPSLSRPQMPFEGVTKEQYEAAKNKQDGASAGECKNGVCHLVIKTAEDEDEEE